MKLSMNSDKSSSSLFDEDAAQAKFRDSMSLLEQDQPEEIWKDSHKSDVGAPEEPRAPEEVAQQNSVVTCSASHTPSTDEGAPDCSGEEAASDKHPERSQISRSSFITDTSREEEKSQADKQGEESGMDRSTLFSVTKEDPNSTEPSLLIPAPVHEPATASTVAAKVTAPTPNITITPAKPKSARRTLDTKSISESLSASRGTTPLMQSILSTTSMTNYQSPSGNPTARTVAKSTSSVSGSFCQQLRHRLSLSKGTANPHLLEGETIHSRIDAALNPDRHMRTKRCRTEEGKLKYECEHQKILSSLELSTPENCRLFDTGVTIGEVEGMARRVEYGSIEPVECITGIPPALSLSAYRTFQQLTTPSTAKSGSQFHGKGDKYRHK